MNTGTLVTSLVIAAVIALLIAFLIRRMMRGWLHRAQRQVETIGTLPPMPDSVGPAIISATKGLYVGSTIADISGTDAESSGPSWLDRVVVGDLGFRSKAVLTRYPEGIMVQRTGATPIWIPDESITAIRTERAIAAHMIVEKLGNRGPVDLPHARAHLLAGGGHLREGTAPVFGIALTRDEACRFEPVHQAGHVAAGDDGLPGELVHSEAASGCLLQRPQHVVPGQLG